MNTTIDYNNLIQKTTNQLVAGDVIRFGTLEAAWFVQIISVEKNSQFNMVKLNTIQISGADTGLEVTYPFSKTTRQWVVA